MSAASRAASPAKLVSASASSTIVRCFGGPGQRRCDQLPQGPADASAGPEHDRAAPPVGEQRLEVPDVRERRDHHRGQVRGIDRDRVGRARDADNAGPRPQSRAGGEPGGARVAARARQDERRAARVFVARRARMRQRRAPDGRRIDEGLRRDGRKRGFGNADVGEPDRAGERAPRQQEMTGLEPEEGHARARFDRDAANLAGFPVDSGGNVDREHGPPGALESVDPLDDRFRFAVDIAGKPGPEQGVDHAVDGAKVNRRSLEDRAGPASGGERGVAFQGVAAAKQPEFDPIAARSQEPRGDETVAAVAAGPAQNGDPAARFREPRRFVGDRETRPLHELNARRSGRNRNAVGPAHFSRRQQFRERHGIAHGREGARRSRAAQGAKNALPIAPDSAISRPR